MSVELHKAYAERFWSYTERDEETGCLIWKGHLSKSGYGQFRAGDDMMRAHRFAFEITNGYLPPYDATDAVVCHTCDVKACVEPTHLFLGTQQENMDDCVAKNRAAKGSDNNQAKLNETQVREILDLYRNHGWKIAELCRKYTMSHGAMSHIVKGRVWAHIFNEVTNAKP